MTASTVRADSPDSATRSVKRVAVIGGGITGLAAAQRLITLDDQVSVTLYEATDRLGGIIRTETAEGYVMELGPDSFITNKPGGIRLCEEIGFTDRLIPTDKAFRRSLVLRNGIPLPVPDGFMLMAPARPLAIATTPILSFRGRVRLLWEAFAARRKDVDDESLASFVRRRFGNEALERLVQPLVGGIYTSDPEKLSLRATLPRFLEMEREYGSVIKATLAEQRKKSTASQETSGSGARYGLFVTAADGLSSLIAAVEDILRKSGRVEFRTSTAVDAVSGCVSADQNGSVARWTVSLPKDEFANFDGVIITLPTHKAAALLQEERLQPLSDSLRQIEYASSAVVLTGHRLSDFAHPLDAFGLVIPHIEGRKILATSFTSRKFPNRAAAGNVLLRTFVGGAMQPELLEHDDEQIKAMVNEELNSMLGMSSAPQFSRVVRYHNAMPQYYVGHVQLVEEIESLSSEHAGLQLAGSAYHGVGIPDSISSGRSAAEQLMTRQKP